MTRKIGLQIEVDTPEEQAQLLYDIAAMLGDSYAGELTISREVLFVRGKRTIKDKIEFTRGEELDLSEVAARDAHLLATTRPMEAIWGSPIERPAAQPTDPTKSYRSAYVDSLVSQAMDLARALCREGDSLSIGAAMLGGELARYYESQVPPALVQVMAGMSLGQQMQRLGQIEDQLAAFRERMAPEHVATILERLAKEAA